MVSQSQKVFYAFLWAAVGALCLAPFVTLIIRALPQPDLLPMLWDPGTLKSLFTTLWTGLLSTAIALIIAVPTSYLLIRTNLPYARALRSWLLFPYFVPSYLFAIAWGTLAIPEVGLLNRLAGFEVFNIYSPQGLVLVFVNAFFPIMVTSLCSQLQSMDPSLEEAGRVAGANPLQVFWKITLPCLSPAIAASALLFLLLTVSAFGIPAIIGNPAKVYVLTTQIFTLTKMGGLNGVDQGFVVSLWLIGLTILLTTANHLWAKKNSVRLTTGKAARLGKVDLGKHKATALCFLGLLVFAFVVLPFSAIFLSSFLRVAGDLRIENLTLANYQYLFSLDETFPSIFNSLLLAGIGALLCCTLGFFVAFYRNRTELPATNWLDKAGTLPFSIPGTVIALGVLVSFGTGWGIPELSLLGTHALLLIAYLCKDLAISIQSLSPAISQIDKSLDEAGRVSGAGPWRVLFSILVPTVRRTLLSVFVLSALPMLSELTMSVLLYGPGTETLGTLLFQLQDYANPLAACAMASVLVVFLASGTYLATRPRRRTA